MTEPYFQTVASTRVFWLDFTSRKCQWAPPTSHITWSRLDGVGKHPPLAAPPPDRDSSCRPELLSLRHTLEL